MSNVKRVKLEQEENPVSRKKYRKKLKKARRRDFFRRLGIVCIALVAVCAVGVAAGNNWLKNQCGQGVFEMMAEAKTLVEESTEDTFRYAQTSYIYADDGTTVIAELSEDEDATYLEYDDIPSDVINAFVAVEDRTFWKNNGIDVKGIIRAVFTYIKSGGETAQGASTITQQLARSTFLSSEKTISRKVKEIFIALEMTKKYSKEQIIEFYCNGCCFANGIYGIEDAALAYFDVSADELTLSQTAYLCAIPNRPEYYNPLSNPENALERRNKILEDMYECGYITEDAGNSALAEDIIVSLLDDDEDEFYNYETTYAVDCAVRYIMETWDFEFQYEFSSDEEYEEYYENYDEYYAQAKHELYTGGYTIYTSINLDAQEALQEILDEELSDNTAVLSDTGIYQLQGAITVIDNSTGKVTAVIGGRSQDEISNVYSLNRAYQGYAQPGSSFKPLAVYTPALENGYTASSKLTDIDVDEAKTSTSSEISEMTGSSYTLRRAVEKSINGCAYWLFNELTPSVGLSYVTDMHFTKITSDDYTLSASLGGLTYGTTTVEMANAYYTLENHGEYTQTDCILSILDSDGNEIYEGYESDQVYTENAADSMTDILMGVITDGTASGMNWYSYTDIQAAGKTGTTNDNKAGWFCGYTPYYTIAVWVGCDTPTEVEGLTGSSYPASIWKEAMLYLISDKEDASFELSVSTSNSTSDEDEEEEEVTEEDISEEKEEESEVIEGTTGSDSTINGDVKTEEKSDTGSDSSSGSDAKEETETTDDSTDTSQDEQFGQETDDGSDDTQTKENTDSGADTQSDAETETQEDLK